jgi:hypothetical protein
MKINILFCLIVMVFFSCNKDDLQYPDIIQAGQKSGNGVLFTDVVPDDTIYDEEKSLDLNGDGIEDVKLNSSHTTAAGFGDGGSWITPLGDNQIAMLEGSDSEIDTISFEQVIGPDLNWKSQKGVLYYYTYNQMTGGYTEGVWNWNNAQNKYIGVRIIKDNHVLYGWIREEISIVGSQKLFEYAITSGY